MYCEVFLGVKRNSPCWCGSGKKYKKCHMIRDSLDPLNRRDLENHSKAQRSRKECCVRDIFPGECDRKIVNAHTISKSGCLKDIAVNSHVMGTNSSLSMLIKNNGNIEIGKVGINKASTFTGFCKFHDKRIFSPIEDRCIVPDLEQLFLLSYRGFCRELFLKEQNKNTANLMKEADRGMNELNQFLIQSEASQFDSGVNLALRDLINIKSRLDDILVSSRFDELNHCVLELNCIPKILVSAMIVPELDFRGNVLKILGLDNEEYEYLMFNCISYDNKGCFIFSWLQCDDGICDKFLDALVSLEYRKIQDALVRFCYSFSENVWASPSWWDSLDDNNKNTILARVNDGLSEPRSNSCLIDGGRDYDAFSISNIKLF